MKSLCHSALFLLTLGLLSLNVTAKSLVNPADSPTHSFICDAPDLEKRAVAVVFNNPQKLAPPEIHYVERAAQSCGTSHYTVQNCRVSSDYIADMQQQTPQPEINESDIKSAQSAIIERIGNNDSIFSDCSEVGRSVNVFEVPTNGAKQFLLQLGLIGGATAITAIVLDPIGAIVVFGTMLTADLYMRSKLSFIGRGFGFVTFALWNLAHWTLPGITDAVTNWWNTPGALDNVQQQFVAAMQSEEGQKALKAILQANVPGNDEIDNVVGQQDDN